MWLGMYILHFYILVAIAAVLSLAFYGLKYLFDEYVEKKALEAVAKKDEEAAKEKE
ncbi:MAG: hypothetical protein WC878_04435 [Candidatus Paceibacterota bacterium]|jgi:hypothetical protein